ncbi:Alpha-D-kanosaminyltransferase [Sodalis glossinidius str. 'morsitans']|uniref:Alpha-D-kanosaminyltransferase n=1 Tax=Sodalis glossinidius (strain morsitans) TaxID=343509 RepID=A0A193QI44_SODGM|nr:glycosyltransferase [Sodalis glossinidius]CRL44844.1 Alpha-D-kanosaminyltransferase [Sodalis glossinidius str. 'morsitans']
MYRNRNKVVYVINSLNPGGAEMGLELLLDNGLFYDTDLHIICLSRSHSDLEDRIFKKNKRGVIFLNDTPVNNKKLLQYAFQLHKQILKVKPSVVITSLSQSVLAIRIIKAFHRFQHITFEHNTQFKNRSAWHLLKLTDRLSDKFWCDSIAMQKALLARAPGVKNLIVPLFYVNDMAPVKQDYVAREPFKLMAVGRLMAQKNYPLLIQIVRALHERGLEIALDIFGEGELASKLRAETQARGLTDVVTFRGFVRDWQSEANHYDAYILMSDFEGLSIATLEAMSVGLPCIVKPVGELENYISDRNNGLKVLTLEDAVNAIYELINDAELRNFLGNNAKSYVAAHYSENSFQALIEQAKRTLE